VATLGSRVDRGAAAEKLVDEIRGSFDAVRAAVSGAVPVRGVMVLQREPLFLVGRGSFIDAMLEAVGMENVAAEFDDPYPRVGIEWLVASAPDLILDASDDPVSPARYWARWSSLPAVGSGAVVEVSRADVTLPGPHLGRAVQLLADAVRCGMRGAGAGGCNGGASDLTAGGSSGADPIERDHTNDDPASRNLGTHEPLTGAVP
jgi:ABC-type Fe3+-hydroxamate transport system substrate-binding protein